MSDLNNNWPWYPATVNQGWLSTRWNRLDGTIYGTAGVGRQATPNSPVASNADADAKVDVQSGYPKAQDNARRS